MIEKCENCGSYTGTYYASNNKNRKPDEWCPLYRKACDDYCEIGENNNNDH